MEKALTAQEFLLLDAEFWLPGCLSVANVPGYWEAEAEHGSLTEHWGADPLFSSAESLSWMALLVREALS